MKFWTKLFFSTVGLLIIQLSFVLVSLKYIFGKVTAAQIVWHLTNSLDGMDVRIGLSVAVMLIGAIVASIGWLWVIYRGCRMSEKRFLYSFGMVVLLSLSFFLVRRINRDLKLVEFYYSITMDYSVQDEDKIDFFKYAKVPEMGTVHFDDKKNLVIVMVESLEQSYPPPHTHTHTHLSNLGLSEKYAEKTLTPNLDRLRERYHSVSSMYEGFGLNWTIAALTGWHFGFPLKVPPIFSGNTYYSHRGFLPNAQSVFDVLAHHGYKSVLLIGSDSNFSGMKMLFEGHGNFRILDKKYWEKQGYRLQDHQGAWGYNDKFILERAREEYQKLKASYEPFVLLVQTIDTHFPNGYCPDEHIVYGDIRDAIAEADRLLGRFVKSFLEDKTKQAALMVVGDHNLMGNHLFLKNVKNRKIYNVFLGDVPKIPDMKSKQIITAMDMAPTLLEAAGGRWKHHQYGLGISIFSKEPSLAEQMGIAELNEKLEKPSAYYSSLY